MMNLNLKLLNGPQSASMLSMILQAVEKWVLSLLASAHAHMIPCHQIYFYSPAKICLSIWYFSTPKFTLLIFYQLLI